MSPNVNCFVMYHKKAFEDFTWGIKINSITTDNILIISHKQVSFMIINDSFCFILSKLNYNYSTLIDVSLTPFSKVFDEVLRRLMSFVL